MPQWDEQGRQFFWNKRTGASQWEPPGLPPPSAGPPPPPAAGFGPENGYGLTVAPMEVEVEMLPILPVNGRRNTASVPKDAKPRSARSARFSAVASRKFRLLDASCIEVPPLAPLHCASL